MSEKLTLGLAGQKLYIAPSSRIYGQADVPSSKYFTLRYLLAAALAEGESRVAFPAQSDDSDALFRGCQALGAVLEWEDEQQRVLHICGVEREALQRREPVT